MGYRSVKQYSSIHEAFLAKSYLENNNIFSWLQDEHIIQMQWYYSLAVGDVKLNVLKGDFNNAKDLLDEIECKYRECKENKCPNCSSSNITRYCRYSIAQFLLLVLSILISPLLAPPMKYGYIKCFHCKAEYYDDLENEKSFRVKHSILTIPSLIIGYLFIVYLLS